MGRYGFSMSLIAPPLDSVRHLPQQLPALPPAREFVTSAGFGGAAALVAALLLAAAAVFAVGRASKRHRQQFDQQERHNQQQFDQQERHNQQLRDAAQHDAALQRCWQRLVWVVEAAALEPAASQGATLGLGPDLALELVRGVLRGAEDLGDATLRDAAAVYLDQFSLVLAQQGSVSAEPSVAGSPDPGVADEQSGRTDGAQPSAAPAETDNAPRRAPAKAVGAGQGRRGRQ
jgi:hypothetical protein